MLRSVNFEMSFWCLQFSEKPLNLKTQIFALGYWAEIFRSFFGRIKKPKCPFEINWPLENYSEYVSVTSLLELETADINVDFCS